MKHNVNLTNLGCILLTVLGFVIIMGCTNKAVQTEPAKERTGIIAKWQNLKYGMFIHFSMNNFAGFEYDAGNLPTRIMKEPRMEMLKQRMNSRSSRFFRDFPFHWHKQCDFLPCWNDPY